MDISLKQVKKVLAFSERGVSGLSENPSEKEDHMNAIYRIGN